MDRSLIDQYEAQADAPLAWIDGLSEDELDKRVIPSKWTMRELVVHMLDSDLVGGERMKRVLAMQNPTMIGYDENDFIARLAPAQQNARAVCELFSAHRRSLVPIFSAQADDSFQRTGGHTEKGTVTCEQLLADYIKHVAYHADFANAKREALGKAPA